MSVCVFVLSFPIPHLSCLVSQAAGPISREPSHDSDFCRLVAGGCDSQRKGEGEEGKREAQGAGDGTGGDGVSSVAETSANVCR